MCYSHIASFSVYTFRTSNNNFTPLSSTFYCKCIVLCSVFYHSPLFTYLMFFPSVFMWQCLCFTFISNTFPTFISIYPTYLCFTRCKSFVVYEWYAVISVTETRSFLLTSLSQCEDTFPSTLFAKHK